ncbi:hypothetical protein HID58_070009 [Brassica napus]|uniref:FBD domain-containing protein n=1 Tax=Brassica napus TaxID=3708 RepID=A0ABQ7YXI5_BRANA|nr:hypothetical protein HID58_070009 [Brassica napus]
MDIVLIVVEYTNRWALEKLISQCPVLENVSIDRIYGDGMPILRVRSQSLLSFLHYWDTNDDYEEDSIVEIDAPMLKYLRISDGGTTSFIIKNQHSLVEADIETVFNLTNERRLQVANEIQKRDMVRDFLVGISKGTSENYLRVDLTVIARPWNLLSSLEHVDVERPLKGEALEMSLVGYLLENSPNLKKLSLSLHDSLKKGESVHKLTLSLDDAPKKGESDIFIELLNFPRFSRSCQIIVR